ncbi:mitogen-activated protein kinase [Lecanicillium sp. MT-2017a]|nr:mitogen-activated protein kinase [Lecanicillium sp. MT-2017a]
MLTSSQDEYKTACTIPDSQAQDNAANFTSPTPETGITIGKYQDCLPIAEGVTSQVYRSNNHALKVITTHRAMEPHNPQREIKILNTLKPPCIPLLETFLDHEKQMVLVFPYMPLTLDALLHDRTTPLPAAQVATIFKDVLQALVDIHSQGIIHRDIKPSAILLSSPTGPAHLSDFGTAWHPTLSARSEPAEDKILDIGTGAYRAPEVLFVDKAYDTAVDMWGLGVMLAEAISSPPRPPFESRAVHEDGNQLGLILSVFKTLGTPTTETWPEAQSFKVSPFELWTTFPARSWQDILPEADGQFRDVVSRTVRYSQRATAKEVSDRF